MDVPPARSTEAAFDLASCDRALSQTRKCVNDSALEHEAKQSASASLNQLTELWAMHDALPPARQQAMCRRILDSLERIATKTGCSFALAPRDEPD
jgi:hypothetical protein